MKTIPDYILVRSREVTANKDDSKEHDVRAKLVGYEVDKGGEKVDAFYASTPPIEDKKIRFAHFSSERTREGKPLRISSVDVGHACFNGKQTRN